MSRHRLTSFLWGYVRQYRVLVLRSLGLMLLIALSRMAPPYIIKVAIDRFIGNRDFAGLSFMALLYLLFIVVEYGAIYLQVYTTQLFGQSVVRQMRQNIFSHVLRLPVPYFDRTPGGKTLNYMTSDMENVNEFITSGIVTTLGDIITIAGILAIMLYLSPVLTGVVILFFVLLFLTTNVLRKRFSGAYSATRESVSEMNAFLNESLSGIYVAKAFSRQGAEIKAFDDRNRGYVASLRRVIHYLSFYFPLVESVGTLTVLAILFASDTAIAYGAVTFGTIVAFIEYSHKVYNPVRDLSEKYNLYQNALSSLEKIDRLNDLDHEPSATLACEPDGDIEFRDVWLSYDNDAFALEGINLTIRQGEKVGIVGLSGSGKTSLINLLLGFYRPSRGEIRIGGRPVGEYSLETLRRTFGIVSQDVYLFPRTIRENLFLEEGQDLPVMMNDVAGQGLLNDVERTVAEDGRNLSEGEKQIISLGRMLGSRPRYLILDEATSRIDPVIEEKTRGLLSEQFAAATWIVIAHTLSAVSTLDKILVIDGGKLIEEGIHQELVRENGFYGQLYKVHLKRSGDEDLHRETRRNPVE